MGRFRLRKSGGGSTLRGPDRLRGVIAAAAAPAAAGITGLGPLIEQGEGTGLIGGGLLSKLIVA